MKLRNKILLLLIVGIVSIPTVKVITTGFFGNYGNGNCMLVYTKSLSNGSNGGVVYKIKSPDFLNDSSIGYHIESLSSNNIKSKSYRNFEIGRIKGCNFFTIESMPIFGKISNTLYCETSIKLQLFIPEQFDETGNVNEL